MKIETLIKRKRKLEQNMLKEKLRLQEVHPKWESTLIRGRKKINPNFRKYHRIVEKLNTIEEFIAKLLKNDRQGG